MPARDFGTESPGNRHRNGPGSVGHGAESQCGWRAVGERENLRWRASQSLVEEVRAVCPS